MGRGWNELDGGDGAGWWWVHGLAIPIYKYFGSGKFHTDLKDKFSHEHADSSSKFDEIFFRILKRHALLKKKMLKANHGPYVSKALRKAIMKRSCLENVHFKQDNHSFRACKKNIVVDYIKKEIKFF